MKARHESQTSRMAWIAGGLAVIALAAVLILNAFRSNMVFFYTPTQVANGEVPRQTSFRIGGLVEQGSLQRDQDGLTVHFVVTDLAKHTMVTYQGILPDLFKEGKGVVAQGKLDGAGRFTASEVLAKHDENYMPPEAAEALKRAQAQGGAQGNNPSIERLKKD